MNIPDVDQRIRKCIPHYDEVREDLSELNVYANAITLISPKLFA